MARVAASGRVASTRTNSILYNGNFEQRPSVITAATTTANRWIDGTSGGSSAISGYGWGTPNAGSGVGANGEIGFDATIFRSGTASMRLSNLTVSGAVTATSSRTATPSAANLYQIFRLLPNTSYTLTGYIRTNNVPNNGAFIDLRQFDATGSTLATTSSNKLAGTDTSWRTATLTVTTNASAAFGIVLLRNTVSGNICDAWFDDITLVPATIGRVSASGRVTP